jgi:signal transduction histidine kinase
MMVPLAITIFVSLLVVFFASPLRQRIEDKFFDLRTRLSPVLLNEPLPLIVTVDDRSLHRLGIKDLDYPLTAQAAAKLLDGGASSVTVLLHPQVYSYDDPTISLLTEMASRDPRLYLAIFNVDGKTSNLDSIPPLLRNSASQVVSAYLKRPFRRSIVRQIELPDPRKKEIPHATQQVASSLRGLSPKIQDPFAESPAFTRAFRLNYPAFANIPHVSLVEVLEPDPLPAILGRPVILGYSVYRPARDNQFDGTLVNSPWQEEGQDVSDGAPLVDVLAVGSVNLAQDTYLRIPSRLLSLFQIILVSALAFGAWRFSAGLASLMFVGGWFGLLILHAIFFAYFDLYIPLADTALFSTLAMMTGALLRIRTDGRLRAAGEAKAQADADVASVQEKFLDKFASELTRINREIHGLVKDFRLSPDDSPRALDAHKRALQSCEELEDYLQGIENFARSRGQGRTRPKLVPVNLEQITSQSLKQFDARVKESGTIISLEIDPKVETLAEPTLLSQILYNLISNAIKYSPPQSTVIIRSEQHPKSIDLKVIDQGPGIPAEYQKLIFEKFYRIKNDLSYKVKGHGLGLYLSQYFAALMTAEIKVQSNPGEGATFILCLPNGPSTKNT